MTAIAYGGTCRDEKTWPAAQRVETPVSCAPHLHHFTANITCHQCAWELKAHPVLQYLNLDGVGAFTRLASHLKRDILQPQLDHNRSFKLTHCLRPLSCLRVLQIFLEFLLECPLMLLMIVGAYCKIMCENTCSAAYIRGLSVVQALWMAMQIELST